MLDVELLCDPFATVGGEVVVDWIGNRWIPDATTNLPDPMTWVSPRVPRPDIGDGFRYGPAEWAAFGLAAHLALRTGEGTMIEAGASQAPWCLSWVRALGPRWTHQATIRALAVEAADGLEATRKYWNAQGLDLTIAEDAGGLAMTGGGWQVHWRRCAVVAGGGHVYFPKVDIRVDNGARPERQAPDEDYRGLYLDHEGVAGIDLPDLLEEVGNATFLHCDLQGAERDLLEAGSFACLSSRTDVIVLGTHSRAIEQLAFDLMPGYGFELASEAACAVTPSERGLALTNDGEQVWLSGRAAEFYRELQSSRTVTVEDDQVAADATFEPMDLETRRQLVAERRRADALESQIGDLVGSTSWRVTRPLRAMRERTRPLPESRG